MSKVVMMVVAGVFVFLISVNAAVALQWQAELSGPVARVQTTGIRLYMLSTCQMAGLQDPEPTESPSATPSPSPSPVLCLVQGAPPYTGPDITCYTPEGGCARNGITDRQDPFKSCKKTLLVAGNTPDWDVWICDCVPVSPWPFVAGILVVALALLRKN